ncbi:Acetyltransferase (GNAT) family protein [Dethiosulfatibacter aminovorans DSM 17477]|uniref:Acetyltransferase (GNAT) family protein n=1 Tax=Dethiosulfatibacter aminovorans DSM 17477 TaxID=1121476 RepID=A0A1M6J665_9FIRM|nr:GNAT family N-acetyltransferase [Dethiosulfatibacter aminovorans]SHJ42193.1 Acetyltransferase (GNAT) family protein [Dethiosulfatibacter aminovorans DSM 17477]
MKIMDLKTEYNNTYFNCLEDWSEEMKDAGNHKSLWYEKMKDKGLRVKLAVDDEGRACGMIQYVPSEYSFIGKEGFYMIMCIWVHGYDEGVGNRQKKGIGTMLIEAAEKDCREMGVKALLAWGVSVPFFMKASWFKKHGYRKIDKDSIRVLLWKPFVEGIEPPVLIKMRKKPELVEGKVKIDAFVNGWCPAQNIVFERTRKAVEEFKDSVIVEIYDTTDIDVYREWGILDGVYVDGKTIQKGPPPSYEKIHKIIKKKVEKLK